MNKVTKTRYVTFRDKSHNRWTIKVEFGCYTGIRKNKLNQSFEDGIEVSFEGHGGISSWQCYDSIEPRTESQASLIWYWKTYHLNGMSAGTETQDAYLSGAFCDEMLWLQTTIAELRTDTATISTRLWNTILEHYGITTDALRRAEIFQDICSMESNWVLKDAIQYLIDHNGEYNDYRMKCLLLSFVGLYKDHEHRYGTGWLYKNLDAGLADEIENICQSIEEEEEQLTQALNPVFDMGAEDFVVNSELIDRVCELRGCDEDEAQRFLALGINLRLTFGDLNDSFKEYAGDNQIYSYAGFDYYIGTEEELTDIAYKILHENYRSVWVDECSSGNCNDSFSAWCDQVIDIDGFGHVLNSWNGCASEVKLNDNVTLYICRA